MHLFRWSKHTQLDIEWRGGFLSLGLVRRGMWKPVAYWSPDATPTHPEARGMTP
jgi:hypothetical protein